MPEQELRGFRIPPFYAGEIGRLAWARAAQEKEVVTMHFGQPTAGPPQAAIDCAHQVLDREALGYFESASLQQRLSEHYRQVYGVSVSPDRILLTTGASAGLVTAFTAMFRPGDEVAVLTPGYPAYRNTLNALRLVPREIRCSAADGFHLDPERLEAMDPAPAGLVLASPANPTGAMMKPDALRRITEICRRRGILLISDEIYHGITFGGRAASALESDPDAVVINSFSKLYRMPGWRLGWAVVPEHWAKAISAYLINMFLTPPTLAQYAALAAMDQQQDIESWVHTYRDNRDRLIAGLESIGIEGIHPPDGAFYVYAPVGHLTRDSLAFCKQLVTETGLALAPGIDFDPEFGNRYVRFSFAVRPAEVDRAVELLGGWLPAYREA